MCIQAERRETRLKTSIASWRVPFGRSCVLTFFLRIAAAKEQVENEILFHSLRLIGNTCADTGGYLQTTIRKKYAKKDL